VITVMRIVRSPIRASLNNPLTDALGMRSTIVELYSWCSGNPKALGTFALCFLEAMEL
jgi:hypothetical protein